MALDIFQRLVLFCLLPVLVLSVDQWNCEQVSLPRTPGKYDDELLPLGAYYPVPLVPNMNCTYTINVDKYMYGTLIIKSSLGPNDVIQIINPDGRTNLNAFNIGSDERYYYLNSDQSTMSIITGQRTVGNLTIRVQWKNLTNLNLNVKTQYKTVGLGMDMSVTDLYMLYNIPYVYNTNNTNGRIAVVGMRGPLYNPDNDADFLQSVLVFDGPSFDYPRLGTLQDCINGNMVISTSNTLSMTMVRYLDPLKHWYLVSTDYLNLNGASSFSSVHLLSNSSSFPMSTSGVGSSVLTIYNPDFADLYLTDISDIQATSTLSMFAGSPGASDTVLAKYGGQNASNGMPQLVLNRMVTLRLDSGKTTIGLYGYGPAPLWLTARIGRTGFITSIDYPFTTPFSIQYSDRSHGFSDGNTYKFEYYLEVFNPLGSTGKFVGTVTKNRNIVVTQTIDKQAATYPSESGLGDRLFLEISTNQNFSGALARFHMYGPDGSDGGHPIVDTTPCCSTLSIITHLSIICSIIIILFRI